MGRFFIPAFLLLIGITEANSQVSGDNAPFPKLAPTQANEPFAPKLSLEKGAEYLDRSAIGWLKEYECSSCHSSYSFLMARPMLGDFNAPALIQIKSFVDGRINGWDKNGIGLGLPKDDDEAVTEIVGAAATLAFFDAQTTGKLQPTTRKALDRMWTVQRPDGSWNWNKHNLPPQELDEYYGAVFAAIGVGHAPDKYAQGASAAVGITRLKEYLIKTPAPNLHHKTFLLWASLRMEGLLSESQRQAVIRELKAIQQKDGGWNLPSLGDWPRLSGQPNDKASPSDGYATGLIIFVLRQAGVPSMDPSIQKGIQWLKSNQRESGRWFTRSLNADRAHYITNAGTAYAIMALKSCEK